MIEALHPQGYTATPGCDAGWNCLECGAWVAERTPDGALAPGWAENLCAACDTADLERAARQLAARLAEAPTLDPDADVRTAPIHLDALCADLPPREWMALSEDDLIDLSDHLEPV